MSIQGLAANEYSSYCVRRVNPSTSARLLKLFPKKTLLNNPKQAIKSLQKELFSTDPQ